jgi:hypothetical protein
VDGPVTRPGRWAVALAGLLLAELALLHPGVFLGGEVLSSSALAYGMAPWRGHRPPAARPLVGNPTLSDDLVLFTPWDAAVRAALAHGRAPLWNPAAGCGMPLLANNQSAVLAPTQAARLVWDSPRARTLGLIARPVLAGLGAFLLLLRLRRSPWGALLGGVAWANAAVTVVWLLYPLGEVAAWLSWVALGLCETLGVGGAPRRRGPPLLALALAATLLAGHLPTAAQLLAAVALGTLTWLAARRQLRAGLLRLALPVLAGVLLAAPQVLPTAAYALGSEARVRRSGTTPAARDHLPPVAAWSWLVPRGFGSPERHGYHGPVNFNEATAFLGAAPLLLALLGVVLVPGRAPRLLAAAGVLAAAIAYGAPLLGDAVAAVPVLRWCAGQRFVVLAQWLVALLAGITLAAPERLRGRRARVAALVAGAALLVAVSRHPTLRGPEDGLRTADPAQEVVVAAADIALATTTIIVAPALAPRALAPLLVGLTCVRGLMFAWGFNPTIPAVAVPGPTPDSRALAAAAGDGRVLPFGWVLRPNTGMLAGIATVTGVDDLRPRRLAALGAALDLDELNRSRAPSARTANLARRCAATVLAADRPIAGERLEPVTALQGPHLWAARLDGAHPLAGWYGAARPVPDQAAALGLLASGGVPDGVVLLEGAAAPEGEPAPAPVPLAVVRDRPERIAVTAEQPRAGWVVVRELADPGWRALVDGRRVATAVADGMFIAVPVGAGRHAVRLEYRPLEWLIARWLAGLGLLAILASLVVAVRPGAAPIHSPFESSKSLF